MKVMLRHRRQTWTRRSGRAWSQQSFQLCWHCRQIVRLRFYQNGSSRSMSDILTWRRHLKPGVIDRRLPKEGSLSWATLIGCLDSWLVECLCRKCLFVHIPANWLSELPLVGLSVCLSLKQSWALNNHHGVPLLWFQFTTVDQFCCQLIFGGLSPLMNLHGACLTECTPG